MKCPLNSRTPLFLTELDEWIAREKPTLIEMDDSQYSWFCSLNGMNLKTVKGVPILWTDAPVNNPQFGHL